VWVQNKYCETKSTANLIRFCCAMTAFIYLDLWDRTVGFSVCLDFYWILSFWIVILRINVQNWTQHWLVTMQALDRLRCLEELFLSGVVNSDGQAFSVETLLDILIMLYDECCNSTLRREKSISEFVNYGKIWLIRTILTVSSLA